MTGKDIPAWIADGGNNAGTIAKSQIKIGDGNTNPDAGLQSSIATPPEAISVAPQKPGVPADSEPKSKSKPKTKSKSEPKKQKALPVRRGSGRTTPKTPKVAPAGIAQASVADLAPAIAPTPDPMPPQASDAPKPSDVPSVVNATELQNEKKQPTEAEIEVVQKEKESYVSGEVFAEPLPPVTTPEEETAKEGEKKQPTREELAGVKDFDELFAVLDKYDGIQNSKGFILQELKSLINQFRVHKIELDNIPLELGLQGVVNELRGWEQSMNTAKKIAEDDVLPQIQAQVKSLEGELDDLRAKYAKKDYEETGIWKRLSGIFGKKLERTGAIDEKTKYQEKLQELLNARLEMVRSTNTGEALKKAMASELEYFSIESKVKLYAAWTETKGVGRLERFGKSYNDLVRKHPWMMAGVGLTILGAGLASGGAVPVTLSVAVFLKRALATPGLFVTADSLLGKASAWARDKSIEKQVKRESKKSPEEMEAYIKKLNSDPGQALLMGKIGGRLQTSLAGIATVIVVGGGYVHQLQDKIFANPPSAPIADIVPTTETPPAPLQPAPGAGELKETLQNGVDGKATVGSADTQLSPGRFDASPGVATEAAKATVEVPTPAGIAPSEYTKLINDFVNQDMKVAKGDSVWKISGRLADQMKLTGGARTDFIDALKDKFGDIQLQAGETINFGAKGIDQEFIEKALGKSGSLTAEQLSSIEANDAKIAEFARANPDITLTNEGVDQILHSNPSGGSFATDINGSRMQFVPQSGTSSGIDSVATAPAEVAPSPAEAPFERPSLVEMRRGSDWFMQVFRVDDQLSGKDWVFDKKEILSTKMADILKVESNGAVSVVENTRFNPVQSENLQKFVTELPKTFPDGKATLTDFFRARPDISVGEYLARVAKAVPQGTRIGLYTTTN